MLSFQNLAADVVNICKRKSANSNSSCFNVESFDTEARTILNMTKHRLTPSNSSESRHTYQLGLTRDHIYIYHPWLDPCQPVQPALNVPKLSAKSFSMRKNNPTSLFM